MRYKTIKYINNGRVEYINPSQINNDNRHTFKGKLYCPEPNCNAKLSEYKINGRVYYRANPNSHNENCIYKYEINGHRSIAAGDEIAVEISEKHLINSVKRSYKNDNKKDDDTDKSTNTTSKKKKVKSTTKSENGEKINSIRGVIGTDSIKKTKEPPILNRYNITSNDIGHTRKITNASIVQISEINGNLKIFFSEERYKNLYALIGDAYIASNGIDSKQINNLKNYIEIHLKENIPLSFYGAGMINKFENIFVLELFYQESFLINGLDILSISSRMNN